MILIITNKSDIHCNPVIEHLVKNKDKFFRLNTECLIEDYNLSFSFDDKVCSFNILNKKNGKQINSTAMTSIWERRPITPVSTINNKKIRNVINKEIDEFLKWIRYYFSGYRSIGNSVWDRPNESKLRQLKIAHEIINNFNLEISIPTSIITNIKEEIHKTFQKFDYLVIKPIGSDGIEVDNKYEMPFYSRKIKKNELEKITTEDIQICPTFVQNYIEKDYELRVTVVGEKIFCCKILSQLLPEGKGKEDWREGYNQGLTQEWITVPEQVKKFCISFLQKINSSFGCFDFIKSIENKFFFLECNPNGQWMWQEEEIGIPISKGIADYLTHRI